MYYFFKFLFAFLREKYATHKILLGSILSNFKLRISPGILRIEYIYYILLKIYVYIYQRGNWSRVKYFVYCNSESFGFWKMRFFKSDINVIDSFDYKILKNFQIRLGIREKKYVRGDLKYSIWKSS